MHEILIAEDQLFIRELLDSVLAAEGYLVTQASTGAEALRIARQRLPRLVLLDASLPGLDGFAVAAELRRDPATRHILIAMLTASAAASDREQARRCGCDAFFTKPIDTRTFPGEIARLLDRGVHSG